MRRYCFNKLPFGISSAPEHFQKRMSHILHGMEGVLCQTDDILIFGKDQEEHDDRVTAVLKWIEAAGVTLNPNKYEFGKMSLKFLGHIIDQNGIRPDPDKTAAIMQMQPSKTVSKLRRFLGMVNQLGKFTPKLTELTHPLRELLSRSRTWTWSQCRKLHSNKWKKSCLNPLPLLTMIQEPPPRFLQMRPPLNLVQYCCKSWKHNGDQLHTPPAQWVTLNADMHK